MSNLIDWNEEGRKKAYAVAVLAEVWAGAQLPPSMIKQAQDTRDEMLRRGTWRVA